MAVAQGFRYATAVLEYLEGQDKPAEVLDRVLNGTDRDHFKDIFLTELQSPTMTRIAKLLIEWLAHSAEPLTSTQLGIILAIDIKRSDNQVDEETIKSIVGSCDGWILIDESSIGGEVRLSHPCAKLHLQKQTQQWIPDIEDILVKTCIVEMPLEMVLARQIWPTRSGRRNTPSTDMRQNTGRRVCLTLSTLTSTM